jgi:hypothetical protein
MVFGLPRSGTASQSFSIARLNEGGLPADLEFRRSRVAVADLTFRQQLRQLGDIGLDAPRLIAREQIGRGARCRFQPMPID